MTKRVTTRIDQLTLRLIVQKATNEKKTVSQTIAELVAASIKNDEIGLMAKNIADLLSSFDYMQTEFHVHEVTSRREFQMTLNILILINEIAKRILSRVEYEAAWAEFETKQEEYIATNRIRI